MASDPDPRTPRVGIALGEGELRTRLEGFLRESGVEVVVLGPEQVDPARLSEVDADLVVLPRHDVPPEELGALQSNRAEQDVPAVVVLSEGERASVRVDLLAAGVARVLDATDSPERLGAAIEAVAEVEMDGGSGGPDRADPDAEPRLADFLSRSAYMRRFLDIVRRVADAEAPLLITGETGVGKERLARAIHAEGGAAGPFVAVNCAALPENLLESELFGHEKGAFTGATTTRKGHFEAARGGTIFLDEIGEMPTHLQVKLLNVLQRKEVQRLGSSKPVRVNARVMAATNRNVLEEVEAGTFREDLYYRLNVVPLEIPALRERREDIPDLVGVMIQALRSETTGARIEGVTPDAMSALMAYDWPGNVRELINVVERGMLLSRGTRITLDSLPEEVRGKPGAGRDPGTVGSDDGSAPAGVAASLLPEGWRDMPIKAVRQWAIDTVERAYLSALLTETRGVIAETAQRAGISPRALYDRMRRLDLDKDDFKDA